MSGGKRIDDHGFWAGKGGKESVFPKGVHNKAESSDGHAGHLSDYEDTTDKIKSQQEMGVKKAKAHDRRPLNRN